MNRTKFWPIIAALLGLGISIPAHALEFKVYTYPTPAEGETEIAYWWTYTVQSDHSYDYFGKELEKQGLQRYTLELEYGLTDHWTVGGYADFELPHNGDFRYVQARALLTRYRFFERGERLLDGAIEVEYNIPREKFSDSEEIETRVILEKDLDRVSIVVNPIFEKEVSGSEVDEGIKFQYATGLYYRASPRMTPGVEFYGSLGPLNSLNPKNEQEHYVFPRLGVKFSRSVKLDLGYGFGLTQASDDQVIKAILEFEFL